MTAQRGALLEERLSARDVAASVEWVAQTESTNDDAKRAAAQGKSAPAVFIADQQTRGRGRNGNVWHAAPDQDLLLSILLRPLLSPRAIASFTLAVGACVREAVDIYLPGRTLIKWPNDVFADDRKLAGILVEGQTRGSELGALIVGVGVNVGARDFPSELTARATSLGNLGASADRVQLAAEIVERIIAAASAFARDGLAPFLPRIQPFDALRGQSVRIGELAGVAQGIDADGALIVETSAGAVRVSSGHVEREIIQPTAG